ncbi:DUF5457 domain-containing protein [Bacteroides gallinaceum]|uniref:DUF5457 domain-containing protein n=1 Tax=Bacteroides gallinaceum TaxID=1462571 RepID=UPI001EF49C4B|nr:DUF5457 domain-containing protein [Bacteroides gallinaceum]
MEPTKEQLQEEIMEILYQKSLQKPLWVTCSEVYWNIKNIKVSERSVREALDWLVKNDVVICQAEKYQISKREFIEMSERKKNRNRSSSFPATGNKICEYFATGGTCPFSANIAQQEQPVFRYHRTYRFPVKRNPYRHFAFQSLCQRRKYPFCSTTTNHPRSRQHNTIQPTCTRNGIYTRRIHLKPKFQELIPFIE